MTLLAKALYDNLADAPDELTFRKGDIVTVIEKDVDGLVGWWLCLLHGRQGIVPGNRLKVIPPVELDQFERDSKRRASYETDEFSDSHDGGNYDRLPAPLKAAQSPLNPPQLSIKDMYHIPLKGETTIVSEEVYDIPKTKPHEEQQEIYDIPKTKTLEEPQEIYDIPKNNNNNNTTQEIYDTPKNETQEIYDIPKNETQEIYDIPKVVPGNKLEQQEVYDIPKRKSFAEKSKVEQEELYDIPSSKRNSNTSIHQQLLSQLEKDNTTKTNTSTTNLERVFDVDALMGEIYDSPFIGEHSTGTIKKSPLTSQNNTPRNSINHSLNTVEQQEIYDVPKRNSYEAPKRNSYDAPKRYSNELLLNNNNTPSNRSSFQDIFHTPSGSSEKLSNDSSKLNQSVFQEDIYSTPKGSLEILPQEIYNTPKGGNQENQFKTVSEEVYDIPIRNNNLKIGRDGNTPSKTLPRGFSPFKTQNESTDNSDFQEIYDIVPTKKTVINRLSADDIYDTPPNNTLKRGQQTNQINNQVTTDEIYDTPPNSTLKRGINQKEVIITEDIYDFPVQHDVAKVMADAADKNAYSPHERTRGLNLPPGMLEDDYVDYHDIWSKEPPKDLMKQHSQSITNNDSTLTPSQPSTQSKRLSNDPKKSVLDQINFEAVKEIEITVSNALQRLGKLHLAVDTCVKALISFCIDDWLDIPILINTIISIRDYSGKLKTALRLLTEFGLGTLVNTTKSNNGEILMDKLIGDVEPLLESYYKVKICLMHLDSNNWSVPNVRASSNEKFFATLNAIMILSQRIPDQCRAFNLSVQNNVHELFDPDPVELPALVKSTSIRNKKFSVPVEAQKMSAEVLKKDTMTMRRQNARDFSTLSRPIPKIPPKPTLPNQRRSLAGVMEPPESPRYNLTSRGFNHIERLVTDYIPEDDRQKKYASDPATPSHTDDQKIVWGGSCPVLVGRNSAAAASPLRGAESYSSSTASITEETIEIRRTTMTTDRVNKVYPSDSNLTSPVLSPLHTRSASLPWNDKLKNAFTYDDNVNKQQMSALDHRDIEALEFFCRQVESQVMLLRDSMKNLTAAVENREEPAIFVSHSKFIILTAHKVVHGGQEISERLLNHDIRTKLKDGTTHLTVCIRGVVSATKTAALEYPEPNAMMEMISSVLALGDAVRIIHSECRRALDA